MARPTKKPPHRGKKSYKQRLPMKKKLDAAVVKRRKNVKSIQRAKEMEDQHRKQRIIEDKYKSQAQQSSADLQLGLDANDDDAPTSDEEVNPYDALLTALNANAPNGQDLLSDTEEEEEENGEEEDMSGEEEEMSGEEEDMSGEEEESDIGDSEGEDDLGSEDEETLGEEEELNESEEEEDLSDEEASDTEKTNLNGKSSEKSTEVPKTNGNKSATSKDKTDYLAEAATNDEATETQSNDLFAARLDYELPAEAVEKLLASTSESKKTTLTWPQLGDIMLEMPNIERPADQTRRNEQLYSEADKATTPPILETAEQVESLGVKASLLRHLPLPLTALQSELLAVVGNYQDVFYPQRTFENAAELRLVYSLHALSHALKTRARILHHNAKLTVAAAASSSKTKEKSVLVPDSYRDQGIARPKVLIILPFRQSAFEVVSIFRRLLFGDQPPANAVMHYERFESEYTGQTLHLSKTNPKPEDYERIFTGNTDDNFRIGLSLTKKSLKLYTDFYGSDILIASPLGLRMVVGAPGSAERDYDFLNSVELLVVDQAELLYAQNWENLLHVLEHLHLQPQKLRDTDFQRVRPWCLSGLGRYYRQSLLFAGHELPEFRALLNGKCDNYAGRVRPLNTAVVGTIRNVIVPIAQTFRRVEVGSLEESFEQRFQYFVKEVLPRLRSPAHAHCLVYVPSYFDFVRLRNYLKAESITFVQICEYTNKAKIARARDLFFHSGAHFLLYSERSHFYRRTRLKGIRHLVMYQPPAWPHFYPEMVNLMQAANQNTRDGLDDSMSVTVLYTKYDMLQLNAVLGSSNTAQLLRSGKTAHTFSPE